MCSSGNNPFSAQQIRPAAFPFLFPPGENAESVAARLCTNRCWGEIVGAHGSGKSALLATLVPALERAGHGVLLVELHDGQRRLPLDPRRHGERQSFAVLAIDGYEQLGRWSRWRVKRLCRRRGWGLLVTAHVSVGLPLLYRTEITPELARKVVERLMGDQPVHFRSDELDALLNRHGGNLRDVLFDLYDSYEYRKPTG